MRAVDDGAGRAACLDEGTFLRRLRTESMFTFSFDKRLRLCSVRRICRAPENGRVGWGAPEPSPPGSIRTGIVGSVEFRHDCVLLRDEIVLVYCAASRDECWRFVAPTEVTSPHTSALLH